MTAAASVAAPDRADRRAPLAALILGACAIGFAPVLVRLAETGPAAAGFWRLAFALPMLAVLAARVDKAAFAPPSQAMLAAGLLFAGDLAFWHYGIRYTSVAKATVMSNLTPVVVTLAAWLAFRERPRRLFLAGLALAVAGAAAMALSKSNLPGRDPPLGDALSLATAFWYAFYFLAVRKAREQSSASRVMFWSSAVGAPILLVVALAMGEDILPAGPGGWAACLGLGVAHVVGQGAIAWALGRLPTATASVVVLVQPVVAALLGWLLFAERLTPVQALGGAAALAGVAFAQWAAGRKAAS